MDDRMTIAEALAELARYGPAVVLGALNTCWDREPEGKTANRLYTGLYAYTVDGVTRTKRVVLSGTRPPRTLYFYYISTPKRVFSEYDVGKNPLKILLYLLPVLAAFVVMTALGFRP